MWSVYLHEEQQYFTYDEFMRNILLLEIKKGGKSRYYT